MTKAERIRDITNDAHRRMQERYEPTRWGDWIDTEISDKRKADADKRQNTQERIIDTLDEDRLSTVRSVAAATVAHLSQPSSMLCPYCKAHTPII